MDSLWTRCSSIPRVFPCQTSALHPCQAFSFELAIAPRLSHLHSVTFSVSLLRFPTMRWNNFTLIQLCNLIVLNQSWRISPMVKSWPHSASTYRNHLQWMSTTQTTPPGCAHWQKGSSFHKIMCHLSNKFQAIRPLYLYAALSRPLSSRLHIMFDAPNTACTPSPLRGSGRTDGPRDAQRSCAWAGRSHPLRFWNRCVRLKLTRLICGSKKHFSGFGFILLSGFCLPPFAANTNR